MIKVDSRGPTARRFSCAAVSEVRSAHAYPWSRMSSWADPVRKQGERAARSCADSDGGRTRATRSNVPLSSRRRKRTGGSWHGRSRCWWRTKHTSDRRRDDLAELVGCGEVAGEHELAVHHQSRARHDASHDHHGDVVDLVDAGVDPELPGGGLGLLVQRLAPEASRARLFVGRTVSPARPSTSWPLGAATRSWPGSTRTRGAAARDVSGPAPCRPRASPVRADAGTGTRPTARRSRRSFAARPRRAGSRAAPPRFRRRRRRRSGTRSRAS